MDKTQAYRAVVEERKSAAEDLKAYFRKLSNPPYNRDHTIQIEKEAARALVCQGILVAFDAIDAIQPPTYEARDDD